MKRILVLTLTYPEFSGSATVLCTKRLIDCMAKQSDFEVHCLCTRLQGEASDEMINDVHVHRIKKTVWKRIYDSYRKRPEIQGKLLKIQKIIAAPLFPCRDFFMYRRYKEVAEVLQKTYKFDIVIAEHHGYNTLMTGCYLKEKYPSIKYYPILWDPILGQSKPTFLPETFVDRRILQCENQVNKAADNVFSIQAAKAIYSAQNDTAKGKRIYYDIPAILSPEPEVTTEYLSLIDKDAINITFSGLLGIPNRDPSYFIHTLNQTSIAERINLLFFSKGIAIAEQKRLCASFKGRIVFHEYIPLNELYTIYRHSDYLLNISHVNANMTPSKIFEYMSYGKPIISTFSTEGDAAKRYLDKYPESLVINQNDTDNYNISRIENFLTSKHDIVEFARVQELFPLNTPRRFVDIIRELS